MQVTEQSDIYIDIWLFSHYYAILRSGRHSHDDIDWGSGYVLDNDDEGKVTPSSSLCEVF